MLREEVTEAEVVDMAAVAISEVAVILEDTTVEDIMADTIMAVVYAFFLEHTGAPASIIGDGLIPIPTIGDGHIPRTILIVPIQFLQLFR